MKAIRMTDSTELIRDLIALRGPSGEERAVTEWLAQRLRGLGYIPEIDPKGNVIVSLRGAPNKPHVLVTAHLDEIALMITKIENDGKIRVANIGGTYTWKWGEGPVEILTQNGPLTAILS